jgi:PAS domain S-box-containing protein
MIAATRLIVLLILVVPRFVPAAQAAGTGPQSVLVIYGEAGPVPAIASFDQGIKATLNSGSTGSLRIYTESLDSSWVTDPRSEQALAELLARKYAGRKFDLVVPCLDSAIRFTLRHRATLFLGVPVVFCGASPAIREAALASDVTGVAMLFDWGATVDLALRLHPNTERVVYVGGASRIARDYEAEARQAFTRFVPPDAATDRESFLAAGVRSIVLVPLAAGDEIIGVLSLDTVWSERRWSEELIGRLPLVAEILADGLARMRADSVLRESEQRFQLMAESAPVLIWMAGADARRTYFNRRWLDFTGRGLEQELGDGWTEGIHPDDRRSCLDGYVRAFAARQDFTLEYRLRGADGSYRWVLDHGAPRIEPRGSFRGYVGSCVDTTDLKATQQALLDSNGLQRAVFASLQGRLAAINREGIIVAANEMWMHWARDHDPDLAIGVSYLDVCRKAAATGDPVATSVLEAIESVLKGRTSRASLEYRSTEPGGDCWFEMTVEPLQQSEGGAIVSHVDVTRRRRAEDDARHQRDELAHVLRATTMGELAGALAHEINQPLAAILTNARAAGRTLADPGRDPEDLSETLADIAQDAKRAAEII